MLHVLLVLTISRRVKATWPKVLDLLFMFDYIISNSGEHLVMKKVERQLCRTIGEAKLRMLQGVLPLF